MYVFDRTNGQPVWPIEERPVPKGDVPGEWYAPTQPYVTKPPPYESQGVLESDLIDFTPELKAEALRIASRYKLGPIFTPPVVSTWPGPLGTLVRPGSTGGTNWPGGALDPETNIAYIYSKSLVSPLGLVQPDPARSDFGYVQGVARDPNATTTTAAGGGRGGGGRGAAPATTTAGAAPAAGGNLVGAGGAAISEAGSPVAAPPAQAAGGGRGGEGGGGLTVQGLPIVKPPYGRITAIDLNKGEIVWQIAHGDTPDNIKNHAALKGVTIPRTGRPGLIGPLATKTLVIAGEAGFATTPNGRGAMLRAYDKATGADAGAVYMPAPESGSPMTYMHNGKQYIVVAISGGNYSAELLAFKLP